MQTNPTHNIIRHLPLALLAIACPALSAADMGGFDIHGSLSLTASSSNKYNYYGDTDGQVDFNQKELIVNASRRFDNGLKLAGQIYAYNLADYQELSLDFLNLDYSFRREFGVRVGRNKLPLGLYNEVQDLDQIRTFCGLPYFYYPRALRPFGAYVDGLTLYGNVPFGDNSLSYQLFGGRGADVDPNHPFMKGTGLTKLKADTLLGMAAVWNSSINGLRFSYTNLYIPGVKAGVGPFISDQDVFQNYISAEYSLDQWIFAFEYENASYKNNTLGTEYSDQKWYAQATYQLTDDIGLGIYYATTNENNNPGHDHDIALATSYSVTPWWLVKGEVHFMDGTSTVNSAGDYPLGTTFTDDRWTYFVVKTTFSF